MNAKSKLYDWSNKADVVDRIVEKLQKGRFGRNRHENNGMLENNGDCVQQLLS